MGGYRRLNRDGELMLHYFEAQATALAEASGNLTDYFQCLAKLVEAHRAKQKALDDQVRVAGVRSDELFITRVCAGGILVVNYTSQFI